MYENLGIFRMTKAQMDWVAQRQEVLAGNIANANTPNYLPKDLKPLSFKEVLSGSAAQPVTAATTNAKHVVPEMGPDLFKSVTQRKTYESTPNGNAVILEEQMAKMGEAGNKFNTSAALFQKYQKMIRTALGNR
ncbi:MAG: flagellar basal body rod protein FlgB [Phaeospirillum sp.]|nr:flagellar basal body rod protein FlgB [Phaeospirillum sp.]